jgi:multimeric flavodoxin WrbA
MRNAIVISASPNRNGLTAACATAALEGIRNAGVGDEEIRHAASTSLRKRPG